MVPWYLCVYHVSKMTGSQIEFLKLILSILFLCFDCCPEPHYLGGLAYNLLNQQIIYYMI